jgi:hypothetical protein
MKGFASSLLRLAEKIMPREHAEWIGAMRAELAHMPSRAALTWAFGCVVAAIKRRLVPMQLGTLRIPRWVMFVEVIGSFVPLTLGWYAITFGQPGVLRHAWDLIDRTYQSVPGGTYIVTMLLTGIVIGLLGPVGLFLGLRYVFTGRALGNSVLGYTLIVVPLVYAVIATFAGYLVGPPDFAPIWSLTIVFTVVPVACVAHLMYLARPDDTPAELAA